MWLCVLVLIWTKSTISASNQDHDLEMEAREFMDDLNKKNAILANRAINAGWDYESNITESNLQNKTKINSENAAIYKEQWEKVMSYRWQTFEDLDLKRMFQKYSNLGLAALPEEERSRLENIIDEMKKIYSTTKLQEYQDPSCSGAINNKEPTIQLQPDLVNIFSTYINDSCKLQYYWGGWYGSVGRRVRSHFVEYVTLSNKAANLNNFSDNAAMWNFEFEMENFEAEMYSLYDQIRPLYKQLHGYVRRRLRQYHNSQDHKLIGEDGALPAHILGNVWAQQWDNVYNITVPYPGKTSVDVTPALKAQNYTALKMFKLAEDFFKSCNLSAMTKTFWDKSIIEKPSDRELVCHASAWDFYDGEDFRIKMCTRINMEDLITIHHEMGHIQYFMQYKDQPYIYREGANSGFHEAIGDTIALSVSTPDHLMKIGLLDPKTYVKDPETNINVLFRMALEKVAFLTFAYVLDLWRWEVFRGKVAPSEYNCRFWELRYKFQGIVPPIDRQDGDFDPGAKYHIIANIPYIRYFFSVVLQFHFHEALCIKAGQYKPHDPASKPLHECSIYQSKKAGNLLSQMLQMGSSRHWKDAFESITGQRNMDARSLLKYFEPLHKWLVQENKRHGEKVGWSKKHKVSFCPKVRTAPRRKVNCAIDRCHYTSLDGKDSRAEAVRKCQTEFKRY